jgi:hypothetical protein
MKPLLETLQRSVDEYNVWASRESVRYSTEYLITVNKKDLTGIFYNKLIGNLLNYEHKFLGITRRKELLRAVSTHDLICQFEIGGFLSKLMVPKIAEKDCIRHIHGKVLLINGLWDCLEDLVYTKGSVMGDLQSIVDKLDNFRYERTTESK